MVAAIEKKLTETGYRMLSDTRIEDLVFDILKTQNTRYLKAIPFLLYRYKPDIHNIYKNIENKKLFHAILDITSKIFLECNIKKQLPKYVGKRDSDLNYSEFKDEFELQIRNENNNGLLIDRQKLDEEMNLQFSLSQLFTNKEKQIIRRLQEDKPISKTDYEYFSRKTRKKIRSIINLNNFANSIMLKMPHYDENLFLLKKKLEDIAKGPINWFRIVEKKILINISGIIKEININKINDKKTLDLLKKYESHDFT